METDAIQSLKEREEKPAKLGARRGNGGVQEYEFFSAKDERNSEFGGRRSRAGKRPRKFFLIMLGGLFLWFCPKAWGTDWKYIGETPNASYYYDAEDMVRGENVVRVWVRAVYSPEGRRMEAAKLGSDIRNLTDSRALEEINCRDKDYRAVAVVVYTMEKKVVISDFKERGLDFILPDSIWEGLYKTLCR
jgi:Surface-adhesin protein E